MQKFDVFWFCVERKFLLYEMTGGRGRRGGLGGGPLVPPDLPCPLPPFLYGPDMWKDIWRSIVRETFTWPNLLKGKDNNPNCAWKISFCILTFIYSLDLLSMMLRRLSAILWPNIWPVSTDFFFYLGLLLHDIHHWQDSRWIERLLLIPFHLLHKH